MGHAGTKLARMGRAGRHRQGGRMRKLRQQIEGALGAKLRRGWILDGAGPARFGWASIHPCCERWEGRTLAEIAARTVRQ